MDDNSANLGTPQPGLESHLVKQLSVLKRTVYIAGLLLLAVAAALAYLGWTEIERLSGELAARPPIAILDVNEIVMEQLSDQPGLSAEEGAVAAYKMGEVLASKGYIVIHKGSIVAYPAEYEVVH